ncbi:MAG: pantetheine-phosphate adenylyltransferase [Negativicutes bacterium]|nr:pantetheine-phosphate adenylyltransferase [Negativicutes bacterium]
MRTAVCPGSFDPVTLGHIDVFERAARMFDRLVVAVFGNPAKRPWFSVSDRVQMLSEATSHIENLVVSSFDGLLLDFVRRQQARVIVRGLRAPSDFEYEFQRALLLKRLAPDVETVFIMTDSQLSCVSSSAVRELSAFGGDVTSLVPPCVARRVAGRYGNTPDNGV